MKITKKYIQNLIKEEITKIIKEKNWKPKRAVMLAQEITRTHFPRIDDRGGVGWLDLDSIFKDLGVKIEAEGQEDLDLESRIICALARFQSARKYDIVYLPSSTVASRSASFGQIGSAGRMIIGRPDVIKKLWDEHQSQQAADSMESGALVDPRIMMSPTSLPQYAEGQGCARLGGVNPGAGTAVHRGWESSDIY